MARAATVGSTKRSGTSSASSETSQVDRSRGFVPRAVDFGWRSPFTTWLPRPAMPRKAGEHARVLEQIRHGEKRRRREARQHERPLRRRRNQYGARHHRDGEREHPRHQLHLVGLRRHRGESAAGEHQTSRIEHAEQTTTATSGDQCVPTMIANSVAIIRPMSPFQCVAISNSDATDVPSRRAAQAPLAACTGARLARGLG